MFSIKPLYLLQSSGVKIDGVIFSTFALSAMSLNEADTYRKFLTPKLIELGWDDAPRQIAKQHLFTDGRIFVHGNNARRGSALEAFPDKTEGAS